MANPQPQSDVTQRATDVQGRNSNIEIKARLTDVDRTRTIAERLVTEQVGIQRQVDTYFRCKDGRLKLREIDDSYAQLIWYQRANAADPKLSDYCIVKIKEPDMLKRALDVTLGISKVVDKTREIFLYENVRIHLDDVKGIGTFLEFEAVLSADDDEKSGREKVGFLLDQFDISTNDLLANSYADMD